MSYTDYTEARKLALKNYRSRVAHGEYPYLPVLDDILRNTVTAGEYNLGLIEIPLDFVVGTRTEGRTNAFSSNFLPLLDESSEFASKWGSLSTSHVEEGIREPIKVCEFLNRFYVIEGNKRVSVLKYFGAESFYAYVTRIMPVRNDTKESLLYYEFVDFYRDSQINYIEFTKLGSYKSLLEEMHKKPGEAWTDAERSDFSSAFYYFTKCFHEKVSSDLPLTPGDAFLTCIKVYGYERMKDASQTEINKVLLKLKEELITVSMDNPVALSMEPEASKKEGLNLTKKIINTILPISHHKLKAAWIYSKTPEISTWVYSHEMGRRHIDSTMKDEVETAAFTNINTEELADKTLNKIIADGYTTIFVVSPQLIDSCVRIAVDHPDINILNCSINTTYHSIRTYYSRIHEAKFLTGAAAGAISEDGRIGYLADYPLYGSIAGINAFALGARMVNPRAKIYLEWNCLKDNNPYEGFYEKGISLISGADNIKPREHSREFGLYLHNENSMQNLIMPVWHWGMFYEQLLKKIMDGSWKNEEPKEANVSKKAINYWWGMSAGVIDIICSDKVPTATKRLINILRHGIITDFIHPLGGIMIDQDNIEHDGGTTFSPEELIEMDWLADNVVGSIPKEWCIKEESVPLVKVAGVKAAKAE